MKLTDKFGLNKTKSVVFNIAVFGLGLLIGLQFREKKYSVNLSSDFIGSRYCGNSLYC